MQMVTLRVERSKEWRSFTIVISRVSLMHIFESWGNEPSSTRRGREQDETQLSGSNAPHLSLYFWPKIWHLPWVLYCRCFMQVSFGVSDGMYMTWGWKCMRTCLSLFKGGKSYHQIGMNPNMHHDIMIIIINGDKTRTQRFLMNLDCRGNLGRHMTKWHARKTPLTFSSIALNANGAYHIMHTMCQVPCSSSSPLTHENSLLNLKQHCVICFNFI